MKDNGFGLLWLTELALAVLLVLASSLCAQAQTNSSALGAAGSVWGGDHVKLEVTAEGATLEFDCASGTLSKPLTADAQGNFKLQGTFTRERPGPVMRDSPNTAAAATYSGTITGSTMRLNITAGSQNDSMGDYVLVRGQPGKVFKCK